MAQSGRKALFGCTGKPHKEAMSQASVITVHSTRQYTIYALCDHSQVTQQRLTLLKVFTAQLMGFVCIEQNHQTVIRPPTTRGHISIITHFIRPSFLLLYCCVWRWLSSCRVKIACMASSYAACASSSPPMPILECQQSLQQPMGFELMGIGFSHQSYHLPGNLCKTSEPLAIKEAVALLVFAFSL